MHDKCTSAFFFAIWLSSSFFISFFKVEPGAHFQIRPLAITAGAIDNDRPMETPLPVHQEIGQFGEEDMDVNAPQPCGDSSVGTDSYFTADSKSFSVN